ncbi:hypothetical protein FACS1894211_11450 [Clostridia bacterium]|nr:hypothetical protein FACS1894211_11450 [Clostridia bacterium]
MKMRRFKSILLAALFAVCAFGFAACNNDPPPDTKPPVDESDFVAVSGTGFNPDEKYKLSELDFKNKDYLDASKNDEVLGIFKDNAQVVQDKTAGTLSGAVQNAVGANATFAITLNYESYAGTVIEFTAQLEVGFLDFSFNSQAGIWDSDTYQLKLGINSDTNQTVKFDKYKSASEPMSSDPVLNLKEKHTFRLVIKNAEAELYVTECHDHDRCPMLKKRTPAGQDEQWFYTNSSGVEIKDENNNSIPYNPAGHPLAQAIPTDSPYVKMPKDPDNPFRSGYLAITWYAPALDSDITLYSYKIYTPYSALQQ